MSLPAIWRRARCRSSPGSSHTRWSTCSTSRRSAASPTSPARARGASSSSLSARAPPPQRRGAGMPTALPFRWAPGSPHRLSPRTPSAAPCRTGQAALEAVALPAPAAARPALRPEEAERQSAAPVWGNDLHGLIPVGHTRSVSSHPIARGSAALIAFCATAPAVRGASKGLRGALPRPNRVAPPTARVPFQRPTPHCKTENRVRGRGWRARGRGGAAGAYELEWCPCARCSGVGEVHISALSNDERLRLTQRGPHWHTRAPQRAFASRSCSTVTLPPATTHRSLEISLTKSSLCETVTTAPLKPLSACVSAASVSLSR